MAVIEFENVSKWFTLYHGESQTLQERILHLFQPNRAVLPSKEQFWALRNVSFEVQKGQTFGLVGSNGSGKSTALKLVAGILEPTSGSIAVMGRVSALLELGAGFHPDLTGRENVYLNGSLLGLSRQEMADSFEDIVDFSELDEFIDMPVKHYSSGMYTRLAFSVAIHVQPEILIVDEVLAVGDGAFQRKCMERISDLKRTGVTILLVSHDLETVARLCSEVLWLDHGQVHRIGNGRNVINEYIGHINEEQQRQMERQRRKEAKQAAEQQSNREMHRTSSQSRHPEGTRHGAIPIGENGADTQPIAADREGEIMRIETVDAEGAVVSSVHTGESFAIRIHYRANQPIENPTFGLSLHREDGVHITGPNTSIDEYTIDHIEGEGYIDYVLEKPPLMAGRFMISASLYDESVTVCHDYVHELHSFIVQPHTVWDELGVVRMAGSWQVHGKNTGQKSSHSPAPVRTDKKKAGQKNSHPQVRADEGSH